MNCKKFILFLILILLPLTLSACGNSKSTGGTTTVSYLPSFNFGNSNVKTMVPSGSAAHLRVLYYMYSPALLGFTKNTNGLKPGDTYSCDFLGRKLIFAISTDNSGKIITFTGHLDDPTDKCTTITISLNTVNNTFSYEEYLILTENPNDTSLSLGSAWSAIYSTLKDVPFTSEGYFHTSATIMMVNYGSFVPETKESLGNTGEVVVTDCFNGQALSNSGPNSGHHITGYYITNFLDSSSRNTRFKDLPADFNSLDKNSIPTYFTDLNDTADGVGQWDPQDESIVNLLFFDHDLQDFYSNNQTFYNPSTSASTRPWNLLN